MPAAWPTVGEMMSTRPVTLPPDAPISRALGVMRAKDIHEIPVLRRSRLIGMITFESIARRASRALATKVEHLLVVAPLITPSTTYAEIAQELLATGLRAAPVVGRKGELLGVVSRTDLVRALPDIPQLTRAGLPTVDEVASPATTFIREDDLCRNLVLQLRALEEHPLPVVDRKGRLVGAVGLKDLAGVLWRPIAGGKRDPKTVTTALDVKVSSIMHAPAVTVPRGTDVATAARRMLRENVSSVFVVDNDRPVRVLGHADLLGLIVARGGRPSEGRARVEDVYVEITGLRGSSDPALLGDIDHLVARALKRMTRSVRPRLLTIHFAPHATHRTNDLTVEARLHTDAGIFYASHTGWNLLAGVSGLLDELANQVQRTRESDRQRNRRSRRSIEARNEATDTSVADPELEAKLRAASDAGDDEGA